MYFGNKFEWSPPFTLSDKIIIIAFVILVLLGFKELMDIVLWVFSHISVSIV
jgi:hypothetical protein